MKFIKAAFTAIAVLFSVTISYSQIPLEMWGTTEVGGSGFGTVFKTDSVGNNLTTTSVFASSVPTIGSVNSKLREIAPGVFCGVSASKGTYNMGFIYTYDCNSHSFSIASEFNQTNGGQPCGGLVKASNGKLYGVTSLGGTTNNGVIYEFNSTNNTITVVANFTGSNGSNPQSSLTVATNGKLYGTTTGGGSAGHGTLYEFTPTTNTLILKKSFGGGTGGDSPVGAMVQATNGKLYGTTELGGIYYKGTLFEYNYTTNTLAKKIEFDGTNKGSYPRGSLLVGSDGLIYGMTSLGGVNDFGTVFEFNPQTLVLSKTVDLDYSTTGVYPKGGFIQATDGLLYATMSEGGIYANGSLCSYNPTSNILNKLIDLRNNTTGGFPDQTLVQGVDGILYGTYTEGENHRQGGIFYYEITTGEYVNDIQADGGTEGSNPRGSLMLASNGLLYGTTRFGGKYNEGTLFELNPAFNTGSSRVLFDFNETLGGRPGGALTEAPNGKLYGIATMGGLSNRGALYEYDVNSDSLSVLIEFDSANGSYPRDRMVLATNGLLYGTTREGGAFNKGTIYSINPVTGQHTLCHSFVGDTLGAFPESGLTCGNDSLLYGTTSSANASIPGILYVFNPANNTFIKKNQFSTSIGANPIAALTLHPDGNFYGTTIAGGTNNFGALYSYNPLTNFLANRFSFASSSGYSPDNQLCLASNGLFYGLTNAGGTNGKGSMFEFDPSGNTFVVKTHFNTTNGASPVRGSLVEVCASMVITSQPEVINLCSGNMLNILSGCTDTTVTYQWYHNNTILSGDTFPNLTRNVTVLGDSGSYYCLITNTCRAGKTETVTVHIKPTQTATAVNPGAISGPADVCPYTGRLINVAYSVTLVSGSALYNWVTPAGCKIISGQGTNSILVRFYNSFVSGTISVQTYYTCGSSSSFSNLTVAKVLAATPASISGRATNLCPAVNYTYTTPLLASATSYQWTVPAGCSIVSGQGTNSLTVSYSTGFSSGNISVKAINSCSTSGTRSIAINKRPTTPGTISGTKNVCSSLGGSPLTYSVAAISGITNYSWTVPANATIVSGQGTNSVSVSFSTAFTTGTISVIAIGSCNNSLASTASITYQPVTPATISGDATICSQITAHTPVTFSITAISGAISYDWIVPTGGTLLSGAGTTSISVLFDSTTVMNSLIKVAVINSCTIGAYRSLSLTTCATSRIPDTTQSSEILVSAIETYPNPCDEYFNLEITADEMKDIIVEVYNIGGEKVFETGHTISVGSNIITTNAKSLSTGTYFVRVIDTTNNTAQIRLIVKN